MKKPDATRATILRILEEERKRVEAAYETTRATQQRSEGVQYNCAMALDLIDRLRARL